MPDAGVEIDAYMPPNGGEYWACFGWESTDYPNVELCNPKCANYGIVGKGTLNTDTSCEIADGVYCPVEYINGQPWHQGVGCCVHAGGSPERVEFVACRR